MANPIKSSDLIIDDGAIRNLIDQLKELRAEYQKALKDIANSANKQQAAIQKTNVTTRQGQQELEKMAKEAVKLQRAKERLAEAESEVGKKLALLREETRKANQENKLNIKLAESAEGSYNKLSAQYALNKKRLNAMSKEQREAAESSEQLVTKTKAIYEEMKRLQAETGKTSLNVGNYKQAIKEANSELGNMPGATGQAVGGIQQLGRAFQFLLKNPIVGFIALVVGGLGALFNAFTRSEKGAELLTRVTGILQGLMSELTGVASALADQIIKAFEDPQQAVKDLWSAIKENIVDRFNGLLGLFGAVGKGLQALWNRDLPELRNAAGDAGKAIIQMTTGLTSDEQKQFAESIRETTKEIQASAKAFGDLAVARRNTARANRSLIRQIEELTTKEEVARSIADDTTKSFKEQQQAAQEARQALEERAQKEIQLARNSFDLINTEIELRKANSEDVEALRDQQLAALQAVLQAERDYTLAVRDNERTRAELRQDALENTLDVLIDGFDNQKTINERIIEDESRTLGERRAILEETRKLARDSFSEQIKLIQTATDEQINANDLINESDAVVLAEKIRSIGLSVQLETRLLEVIRERRLAISDLAIAEKDLNEQAARQREEQAQEAQRQREQEYRAALELLDQEQELERSKFALKKQTAAEAAIFELELEREKLEKILKLNEGALKQLSDLQIETIKNQVAAIDNELNGLRQGGEDFSIYGLLGFKLDEDEKEGIKSSFDFARQSLISLNQQRIEAANQASAGADRQAQAAERALEREIDARNEGFASNVETAKEELRLAQENQRKALREQEKAQKREQIINTLQQSSNLITASSKIWAQLGFPFALPAIGTMWGSFIAAKVRAFSLTKDPRGEGSYEFLNYGDSHASGNDIPLGLTKEGKLRTAEKGEGLAVFNKRNTRKYGPIIPDVVDAINRGVFEHKFERISQAGNGAPAVNIAGTDTRAMEGHLKSIHKELKRKQPIVYTDSKGNRVEQIGNVKRIIRAS